jgi:hypothetical protein
MIFFNEVVELKANDMIYIQAVNISHGHKLSNLDLATSFNVIPLVIKDAEEEGEAKSRYIQLLSDSCDGNGGYWNWVFEAGDKALANISQSTITIKESGLYILMIKVPGASTGNNGYAELRLNGSSISQSWSNNANGYHNMIHFNETLELKDGDQLQVYLANLNYSFDMNEPRATKFVLLKI